MIGFTPKVAQAANNPDTGLIIADDGQSMFFPVCSIPWQRADRRAGHAPGGKKQQRHIGPIDSAMPEKTHSEGALIFHAVTATGCKAAVARAFSNSTGER